MIIGSKFASRFAAKLASAIVFYTVLPVPGSPTEFQSVSHFAPLVGLLIGGLLSGLDGGMDFVGVPTLTRSALLVVLWIGITGGLHLDGAMDTADGLAVTDPDRRLQVMADSVTGAFGAMAAVAIILLKTTALTDLDHHRWLILLLAAGWGRWAQQIAIARYPYLKPTGKGAFHKQALRSLWDTIPSLVLLLGLSLIPLLLSLLNHQGTAYAVFPLLGCPIALLIPAWFNHKLGGQTGDTYGATVEWAEALFLVVMTIAPY
ncbi:adenosylcobinamide-GDP ribazoletransferase [Egbenema bharatensis]|uniref:adenosylcobinamide-GDP ribazoletransferase n=1 Tax=Egbenema bharatensis TaxID=3463334 RepID=UPI003A8523BC